MQESFFRCSCFPDLIVLLRCNRPFADWPRSAAVQALRRVELRAAVRADALRGESVKSFSAFAAAPKLAQRRRGFAGGTGETLAARNLGDARQRPRLFQAAPAIDQNKRRHDAQPDGLRENRQRNQRRHAEKTDDARDVYKRQACGRLTI